jgi:signal transduction histidine kinase
MTSSAPKTAGKRDSPLRALPLRAYANQVDRFVPARFEKDADLTRRARILIGYAFLSVPPGLLFVVLSVTNYRQPRLALMTGASTLTVALMPLLLRRTGSLVLATGGLFAACLASTLTGASSAEGQELLTLPWLAMIPLLATALAGRGAGCFWAIVCIVLAEGALLAGGGGAPRAVLSEEVLRVASAWSVALLILVALAFALLHESSRVRMMAALNDAQAQLEAAREKALRADRLASLGRMAAGVAHEINNPMAFVSSNVTFIREDLARGPLDAATQREYLSDILPATEEGIRRVVAIVGDLARFARGETEVGVAFDLNGEIRTALRMCEKALGDARLVVKLGELPPIVGRPREIAQVTMNLVINAAHAVKGSGEIRVETESAGEDVVLRVTDDGAGMAPDVKARLFEPFFTTKGVGEGTGLGLAVVHGIVRAHGGSVSVESAPGEGSTFEVRLPQTPPNSSRARFGGK